MFPENENKPRIKMKINQFEFAASQAISQRHNFIRWKRYRSIFADFFFALKRKIVDFLDIYYTILDATGINPQKVINKDAQSKDRGIWIPLKT